MHAALDCYPCFLRQALQTGRFAGADEETQHRIMQCALQEIQSLEGAHSPVAVASKIQAMVSRETQILDPYASAKVSDNQKALQCLPALYDILETSKDPLNLALQIAAVGNIMDYGAFEQFDVSQLLDQLEDNDFAFSVRDDLEQQLSTAETLSYFADNSGEIVFDKLLIQYLIKRFSLKEVVLVVRSAPFLNDVCESDARSVGMHTIPQVTILSLPISTEDHDPAKFESAVRKDVIIAKGMANFENFNHRNDFYFLFIAKCKLIANLLSQRTGKSISVGDQLLYHNPSPANS